VRRIHLKYHPVELQNDREADQIIESLLPETAERLIKRLVDEKGDI
jgi:predicted metal-dependent RNase